MSQSVESIKAQECYMCSDGHSHNVVIEIEFDYEDSKYRKIRCKDHNTIGYMKIDPCKMTYEMITQGHFEHIEYKHSNKVKE